MTADAAYVKKQISIYEALGILIDKNSAFIPFEDI
jgi:hypothetical protein